jgi:hypothetical protein
MRALLIAGAAVLLLSACASETEIAQKNCAAAGFQEGTNEYADCVRKDVDLQLRQEIAISDALGRAGQSLQQQSQQQQLINAINKPVTCYGGYGSVTCY